jgi:Domain of unknown function (DUF6777)
MGMDEGVGRWRWISVALFAVACCAAVVGLSGCFGGEDEAQAQTVRFQRPTDPGPKPFTKPADVKGKKKVDVGSGPFGGTGSDLVCDRELLIRSLKARPDRLREWARIRGIEPTYPAVARYIRSLKPSTLTQDTRVTNYTYENGRAVGFQAILQAGTAVLVDKYGKIVARCRCGNPLTEPQYIPEAKCYGCPPNYTPPEPCDGEECWETYPDPPETIDERANPSTTPREPTGGSSGTTPSGGGENPSASWNRSSGTVGDAYVFFVEGFAPNSSIAFTLTRPSGVTENYTIETDASGSGQHSFPPTNPDTEVGTYTGVARNPSTGATATATTTFTDVGGGGGDDSGGGGGGDDGGTTTEEETGPGPGGGEESDLPVCDPVQPVEPCRPG